MEKAAIPMANLY